jgi:hypothetical protein
LEGQPVVLKGLKSTVFNGQCGLVVGSAGPAGRVCILLWSEFAPKMFPVTSVFDLEPGGLGDCMCCACLSTVSLLDYPACSCGETSDRYQLFTKFRRTLWPEEDEPISLAVEPSPPRAVQPDTT